jgi:hypothetical protein
VSTQDLKARLRAAMSCLKAVGSKPTGVTMHADGSFTVLTGEPLSPVIPSANEDDWLMGVGDDNKKRKTGRA